MSSSSSLPRSEDLSHLSINASDFVSALCKFNESIPNCDAMERFYREPTLCLANNARGLRCGWRIPPENREMIMRLLSNLAARNIIDDTRRCVIQLAKLTNMAVCHFQRVSVRVKIVLLVLPDLFRGSAQLFTGPIMSEVTIKAKIEELSSLTVVRDDSKNHPKEQEVKEVDAPAATSTEKITYWLREMPKMVLQYLPEYLPYHPPGSSHLRVSEWVMNQAQAPFSTRNPNEIGEGYLYVYWNRATFGVRKIGYTSNVGLRLKSWETECNHIAEEQYRSPFKVKHVARVERLVHADLQDYRVFEPACHGCLKSHIEWFKDVDFEIILKSIEFWTQWIMKEPYDVCGSQRRLKQEGKNELLQYCARLSGAKARGREASSTTRTSPRYNLRRRTAANTSQDGSSPTKS